MKEMKPISNKILFLIVLFVPLGIFAKEKIKLQPFPINEVRLLDSPFKEAEETDLKYILSMSADRLLAPYLREAGLTPKASGYTNWENTGMDGHIGGHYISALSLMYASTGNKQVLDRLNYMLSELKKCQDKTGTGYLGGIPESNDLWQEVAKGNVRVSTFNINKSWVPLYNIHKMYAGLLDAYKYAGIGEAKEMLIRFTDWMIGITSNLTDEQVQKLLESEHGGLNFIFAEVYNITRETKYMELALRFSHQSLLIPLSKKEDVLNNKHANTQIPKVIGFERIAELTGDEKYYTTARFFWDNVINQRTIAIGGNSVREHFHPTDDFSSMITSEQGPETCNTYNMLKLTEMLYYADGDEKYVDYFERALYNHILSSQHPEKGGFVYFTPMRPGHYRVYSQAQTSMWCCVGSGMENHAKYGEFIYSHDDNDLFVNLFIPSRLDWKEKGIIISQQTKFPESEETLINIEKADNSSFAIQIRYPIWISSQKLNITVNGQSIKIPANPGSYVSINRIWETGDRIKITLPMQTTIEQMPDHSPYFAVLHGPIVLAAKTDTTDLKGLFADDSRMGHAAQGKLIPLQDAPLFVSDDPNIIPKIKPVSGEPLVFSVADLIYPEKYKSIRLIPFYKLHDSRYVIYWQLVTSGKLKEIQDKTAQAEAEIQKLNDKTLDVVFLGEQQPESDHFIESEKSITGVINNRHWRSAKAWFSYKLVDKNKSANKVQVIYWGSDPNMEFLISINGEIIANVNSGNQNSDGFITKEYPISPVVLQKSTGTLLVKISAKDGSETDKIFEIRLLK